MNGRDEELLSAYFDGELTGDEQSRAEQLLAENLAAREALDELADVSSRLRQLPRPPAPAGVREDVLQRIRNRSAPVQAPAATARPGRRRPAAWIGAVAASLLVAAVVYRQWPEPQHERQESVAGGITVATRDTAAPPTDGLSPLPPFGAVVADAYHASPASTPAKERFDYDSESLERQSQNPTSLALSNSVVIQDEFRQLVERGEAPVPGQVISDVTHVGGQVLVAQHRAVDTLELFGEIQAILTSNGITNLNESAAPQAEGAAILADEKRSSKLQAIYVEAPTTNFNLAVRQIANLEGVTKVSANTVMVNAPETGGADVATEEKLTAAGEADKQESQSQPFSAPPASAREGRRQLAANKTEAAQPDSPKAGAPTATPALGSLAYQEQAPTPPPQSERYLSLAQSAESRSIAAYQVVVPARQELLEELQQQPAAFFDAEQPATAAPAEQSAVAKKPQSQVLHRLWNLPQQGIKASPADPDRVRAVILLVPEQKP